MSIDKIEKCLIDKMETDFQVISPYVENHPFLQENACYSDNNNKCERTLNYMSYTRPLFTDEEGTYLMMMVTEWRKDDQEMKTIYLWNGKIYSSFQDLITSLKYQFSKFKMIFDFS